MPLIETAQDFELSDSSLLANNPSTPDISKSELFSGCVTTSVAAPSGQELLSVPQKDLRRFLALIRKFHNFILEFDNVYKLLSIWSSNSAISYRDRQNLLSKPLATVVGRDAARFLRAIFRRVLQRGAPEAFRLSVSIAKAPRWFQVNVYSPASLSKHQRWIGLKANDITEQRLLEERLCKFEVVLKHAEEAAEMGTWEHDLATGSVKWSRQLFRLHGLESTQLPASIDDVWQTLNFKNIGKIRRDFETAIRTGVPFRFSEPYTLPNGAVRIFDGFGAPIADSTGKIVRMVGMTRDITKLSRTEANLRRLSHQLLTIRTEEQRRMSRELHETTAQTLAALKMTLAQIERSVPRHDAKVHNLVRTSRELASAAVREVRFVSAFLHPPLLEETGLVVALSSYARLFAERGGVPVKVHIPKDFGRLDQDMELTIFRIVQESLTNVHRHARASTASIRVERTGNKVRVEVKDDGIGIFHVVPGDSPHVPLGVGIAGIRERINQLHGEFDIISAPGAGTTIQALLPINSKRETLDEPEIDPERESRSKTIPDPRRRRSRRRSQRGSGTSRN